MKFYWSSKHIPQLQTLSTAERLQRLHAASKHLTPPEKLFLNLIKLAIFIPAFVLLLNTFNDWRSVFACLLIFFLYPLVFQPINMTVVAKYLDK